MPQWHSGSFPRAIRVSQENRKEKNRAKDAHERLLLWSARTLEGYYQLAGEHELAERIRPATRRLGRPASPQTPDTSGEETPGTPPDEEESEGSEPEDPDAEDPDGEDPDTDDPDGEDPDTEDPDAEDPEEPTLLVIRPPTPASSTADD